MVTRTAKIIKTEVNDEITSHACTIQLSQRDLKEKVFDDEGNRVYGKFDMPDLDEEEDKGIREIAWEDLGVVKLVLRPEAAAEE